MNTIDMNTSLRHGSLKARVLHLFDTHMVIKVTDGLLGICAGKTYLIDLKTMHDQEGDLWRIEEPYRRWVNVYTDGFGRTEHKSFEQATHATQYGRVRIGIIEVSYLDGQVVGQSMIATEPTMRDRGVEPHNPFAAAA